MQTDTTLTCDASASSQVVSSNRSTGLSCRPALTAVRILTASLLAITALMLLPGTAWSKDYIIEIVVFKNGSADRSTMTPALYVPRIGNAMSLTSEDASAAGFEIVTENLSLTEQAESIKNSGQYQFLRHFAWRQPGLDDQQARAIRINIGSAFPIYIPENYQQYSDYIPASINALGAEPMRQINTTTISGVLKVRLGRFLHLDSTLAYTEPNSGVTWRLDHSRKMRSRELHYIDNPRFGMLVRIVPVEGT